MLTGGESACMVMCDCILRILPGVIRQDSSDDDSFSNGLLEYPQYTRPEIYDGKRVPDVLLSGHHANIKKYRHEESLKRTAMYRPDLLENLNLNKEDKLYVIDGQPPDLKETIDYCPFVKRCIKAMKICMQLMPEKTQLNKDHYVKCWLEHEFAPKENKEEF